jgi:hypothetical protein
MLGQCVCVLVAMLGWCVCVCACVCVCVCACACVCVCVCVRRCWSVCLSQFASVFMCRKRGRTSAGRKDLSDTSMASRSASPVCSRCTIEIESAACRRTHSPYAPTRVSSGLHADTQTDRRVHVRPRERAKHWEGRRPLPSHGCGPGTAMARARVCDSADAAGRVRAYRRCALATTRSSPDCPPTHAHTHRGGTAVYEHHT